MAEEPLRSYLSTRPWTLQLLVALSLISTVYSLVFGDDALSFASILFSLVFVGLLKLLWDGRRAIWWLFVVMYGVVAAGSLTQVAHDSAAWSGVLAGGGGLLLLVLEPTQEFVKQRSAT